MIKRWITACVVCLNALAVYPDEGAKQIEVKDAELRRELLLRMKEDQDARIASMNWCKEHGVRDISDASSLASERRAEIDALDANIKKVDKENTIWLKQVVKKRGWPTRTLVGQDGATAAWILVQHSDADSKFQRECLDLMAQLQKGEVSQENFAYLTDRVLLAEGKKQMYGTQFVLADGKLQPRPLQDEVHVDSLRATVGLPPLAEYLKQAEKVFGGGSK